MGVTSTRSRRICFVTATRAEYGLMRNLMRAVDGREGLELQLVVSGTHLSPQFGLTRSEIEQDGFVIEAEVETLGAADTPQAVAETMAKGLSGLAEAFAKLRPDVVVLLGDRYETLATAAAAFVSQIPIAHIHGGEVTEGVLDDGFRHAITKMSHLHFAAAEPYRRRIIQLGEAPERVFNVGAPGLDNINESSKLSRPEVETRLRFELGDRNALVTFHPTAFDSSPPETQLAALLESLRAQPSLKVIFTGVNADAGGRRLMEMIREFGIERSESVKVADSLGASLYLGTMRHMDAVVGNSSSGIIEAPSVGIPTINIGDRQKGRLRASSVIDCLPTRSSIDDAFTKLWSQQFQAALARIINPYGAGGASERMLEILDSFDLSSAPRKAFYDLPAAEEDI